MLISNSKKFIFVHIPKTGGTSITEILDKELKWDDIVLGGTRVGEVFTEYWSPRFGLYKHTMPPHIKSVLGDEVYCTYRKFVVVRNPISRVLSAYKYIKTLIASDAQWFMASDEYRRLGDISDFNTFASGKYFRQSFDVDPSKTHDIQRCFLPQSYYYDEQEAKYGRFDYYKLEDLSVSLDSLVANMYIKEKYKLSQENRSMNFDVKIDHNIIEDLISLYAKDFGNFQYDPESKI
jgi:hypothetical protein